MVADSRNRIVADDQISRATEGSSAIAIQIDGRVAVGRIAELAVKNHRQQNVTERDRPAIQAGAEILPRIHPAILDNMYLPGIAGIGWHGNKRLRTRGSAVTRADGGCTDHVSHA